jgi:hypothetical protein
VLGPVRLTPHPERVLLRVLCGRGPRVPFPPNTLILVTNEEIRPPGGFGESLSLVFRRRESGRYLVADCFNNRVRWVARGAGGVVSTLI